MATDTDARAYERRAHSKKLFLPQCCTAVRKSFFSMRVTSCWNALPHHVA